MFPQQLAELLIKAIKVRPALYNKLDPRYHSQKKFKYDLWREVCAEVDPNWTQMTPQHKMEYQRHLQRRWKSLRDCFTRELTTQKQERMQQEAGELVKHRKKYENFKEMLFLLDGSEETFKPDTESDENEELLNLQKPENLKQEMDTDESESSCRIKKQLFPHQLSGHLIRAIEERPDLYKRTSNTNKSYKHGLWREVCKEVNPSWSQLPQKRKAEYLNHLKRRWKSLRDCFSRELSKQKKDVIDQAKNGFMKERKKYEHFDEMSFLLENCDETEQQDSDEESGNSDEDPLEQETESVNLKQEMDSDSDNSNDDIPIEFVVKEKDIERKPKVLKKHKKMIRKFKGVDDEDRQFLISLLPSFRRLNAKQRLEAKIRFLNVLKDVRFRDRKKKVVKRR